MVQAIATSSDALYLRDLDGGLSHVRRLDYASGSVSDVALPAQGSASGPVTDPARPEILVGLQGWVSAPAFYAGTASDLKRTDIVPPWKDDLSPYESIETAAMAPDGTKIPLSIVYRKGLKRDGSHPVWLTGYGAYGIAMQPAPWRAAFSPCSTTAESMPWPTCAAAASSARIGILPGRSPPSPTPGRT